VGHFVSPFFPEEMGQLHTCSEQTNVISNSASAAELEIELESLPFIEDVDVSVHEDLKLGDQKHGIIGLNRHFTLSKKFRVMISFTTRIQLSLTFYSLTRQHIQRMMKMGMKGFSSSSTKVPVQVSSNGQDYSTSTTFYLYSEQMKVEHIFLTRGFHKTKVLIVGRHFVRSPNLRCHFVGSTFLSSLPVFH
jgi:hypothetical protein